MARTLVVLSGGQDSTTCLFLAKKSFGGDVHAITFDYGQRHRVEIAAAIRVAQMAGVKSHEIIKLPDCLKSVSPLTSQNELERYENFEQMDKTIGRRVELTFVPMRNTLFLTIAANRAVALGCGRIYAGVSQADNANYPDCTLAFIRMFEELMNESLGRTTRMASRELPPIQIMVPLIGKSKAETVKLAHAMPACWEALAYTHTSYDGQYPPTDMNHANVLRAQGFLEAGLPDPLVVRAWSEGLMPLPATLNYRDIHDGYGKGYPGEDPWQGQ